MRKPPSTRVMEIFSQASASRAAQRLAYLDGACGGDPELRAEVESLLATLEQVDHFLDAPTVNGEAGGCDAAPDAGRDATTCRLDADTIESGPAQVGRYSIVERIGEGGFGVVYR